MRRIALDAMGSDAAPGPEIEGALAAVLERAVEVILVGDESRIRQALAGRHERSMPGRLTIRHASQVVTMDDHPGTAFKTKKDSSMRVCFNLAVAGEADAVVSAGNSGAMMAHGLFVMKRIAGVDRPGIVAIGPTQAGSYVVVLDVGANTELKPPQMVQLAILGAGYSKVLLGIKQPRVGVLSNGEEEGKGTEVTREVHRLLRAAPISPDYQFAGYAEGRDFFPGRFDVIVTDGFTGNIALKTFEGTARLIFDLLSTEVRTRWRYQLGAWLMMPAFRALRRRLEADEHGGALLLGLSGVAMICHGSATAKAMKNAIFAADRLCGAGLTPALAATVARNRAAWEEPEEPPAQEGDAEPGEGEPAPGPSRSRGAGGGGAN